MIVDRIENIKFYAAIDSSLSRALEFAVSFDLSKPDGVYEVEGENIFAKVATYETSLPEKREFEAHLDYADIQVLCFGEERIDVSLEESLKPVNPYDHNDDVVKLAAPAEFSTILLKPGLFAIFFPQDVHRPNCTFKETSLNRKICMKVRI
jgi:biofilm protein TabA